MSEENIKRELFNLKTLIYGQFIIIFLTEIFVEFFNSTIMNLLKVDIKLQVVGGIGLIVLTMILLDLVVNIMMTLVRGLKNIGDEDE